MSTLATTKMSSKGQVVIPEKVRNDLGLKPGDEFVVLAHEDAVMLKSIKRPSMKEFNALVKKARRQAKAADVKRSDVAKAIAAVRGRK